MLPFAYHRPGSLPEAASLLRTAEDGRLLAGGQTLIPVLRQRLAAPSDLVDLGGIEGLRGVRVEGGRLTVLGMTPHAEVAASPEAGAAIPALAALAGLIGDPAVRNRGTIGGSVANNDPSADYPAACLALGATIVTDRGGYDADDFFRGLFETALEPGEIVTRVEFPLVRRAAYEKFRNPASRFALTGVFVARTDARVRVAVTGAGQNGVFRWAEAEEALTRDFHPNALDGLALAAEDMIEDIHGSGAYRAHLARVLTGRAVARIVLPPQ